METITSPNIYQPWFNQGTENNDAPLSGSDTVALLPTALLWAAARFAPKKGATNCKGSLYAVEAAKTSDGIRILAIDGTSIFRCEFSSERFFINSKAPDKIYLNPEAFDKLGPRTEAAWLQANGAVLFCDRTGRRGGAGLWDARSNPAYEPERFPDVEELWSRFAGGGDVKAGTLLSAAYLSAMAKTFDRLSASPLSSVRVTAGEGATIWHGRLDPGWLFAPNTGRKGCPEYKEEPADMAVLIVPIKTRDWPW